MMEKDEKDDFLDEIDRELENLNQRLKQVMSEADALLSQHLGEGQKNEPLQDRQGDNEELSEEG